jgi:hypothetical protein
MIGNRIHRAGRRSSLLAALAFVAICTTAASAAVVDVDVVSDARGTLPLYGAGSRGRGETHRSYLEARDGERYGIRIRNNTGGRIAVVVAVDGRNIISGTKSNLRGEERMYVLRPYESATYEGWRTARDTVNRFYFTDPGDSYAAAFGDRSAMGVIAVAVYREAEPPRTTVLERNAPGAPAGNGKGADAAAPRSAAPERRSESAGTGFGEETGSPSVRVAFFPETRAAERHFLKYEWRDTLCRKGIIDCRWSRNRFWDDDEEYAPFPPGR